MGTHGRKCEIPAMKLLVAEDERLVRDLLRDTFELQGLTVAMAETGADVRRLAQTFHPDLILLDVHLGPDDGFALCRRLKADPKTADIAVIFLTGRHDVRDRVRGLELGAVDYICKPFDVEELLARVLGALRVKAAHDAFRTRQRELETLAHTDPLTGLLNRRSFGARLARELAHARHGERPLAFAMLDLDHFKAINDQVGHDAGDAALCLVADVLRGAIRGDDVAVRWGGEEFLLLLPNTAVPGARALVERIRERLRETPLQTEGGDVTLRLSAGVSELWPDPNDDPIRRADELLLRAKRTGRDRVCAA